MLLLQKKNTLIFKIKHFRVRTNFSINKNYETQKLFMFTTQINLKNNMNKHEMNFIPNKHEL